MTNRLSSSLLFLLASAYTTLAASSDELVSREYTNPDPANDPKNLLGYVPQNKYTYMALRTSPWNIVYHSSQFNQQ